MTTYRTILLDDAGPVARLTLNRPDKRNPIGPETCGELVHALGRIRDNAAVRVAILTGAGTVFSAGGDLAMMGGAPRDGAAGASVPMAARGGVSAAGGGDAPVVPPASLVDLLVTMHATGKPIIAMVNGHALAGGLGLMVACDLVIAADTAQLGTTEIGVGLWPMMITAEITRSIGRKLTLEMMLTGRRLTAAEALAAGLVNRVVPAAELEAETVKLASELADKSPAAIALGLRAFYATQDLAFEPQLKALETELGRVLALEDAAEGIAAFLGKRKPVWKGR